MDIPLRHDRRTAEMPRNARAPCRAPSLGQERSKPVPVPLPHPRFACARLRLAPLPCRWPAPLPRQAAALGGGRSRFPVSSDRTRGNDASMEPATFPKRDE